LAKRIGERSWDGTRPAALVLLGLKERGEGGWAGPKERKRGREEGFGFWF
jgi:hypothetical protein